jgi:predicted site-specific integrase-resolvase
MGRRDLLTSFGAAKVLGLSVERIRQLYLEGKLKAITAPGGRFRFFRRADVERLAVERQKKKKMKNFISACRETCRLSEPYSL